MRRVLVAPAAVAGSLAFVESAPSGSPGPPSFMAALK